MAHRKSMLAGLAAICLLAGGCVENELTLVKGGKPNASIVIAKTATKSAQFAAHELRWHVKQMTGAELPIVTDDQKVEGIRILVGESAATRALRAKPGDFQPQEHVALFLPDTLILMGDDKPDTGEVKYDISNPNNYQTWPDFWGGCGTLYAAYDFLEKCCGVRWLNPSETGTVMPQSRDLVVKGSELRRKPFFRTRYEFGGNCNADYDAVNCMWNGEKYKAYEAASFPELHKRFTNDTQYMLAKRAVNSLFLYRMRAGGELCYANHSLYGYYDRFWEPCKNAEHAKRFVKKTPGVLRPRLREG